ncbi:MAG: hypothetical protein IJ460_07500 [Clostridia bacterium]|nr:hypothetical protein [Clostridia bacterium]
MNTVREIEETSTRLHNLIYNEINALLEKISQEAAGNEQNNVINIFESVYPLSVNIAFLRGKRPTGVIFEDGKRVDAATWKQVAEVMLADCITAPNKKSVLTAICERVSGNTRVILSKSKDNMRSPLEIDENLYIESHYDTESLLRVLTTKLFDKVNYNYRGISVVIRTQY